MALLVWDDSYSVDVAALDTQHKKLLAAYNQLAEAMLNGKGKEVIRAVLYSLNEYVTDHFSYEERLMRQHAYLDETGHTKEHAYFQTKVKEFEESLGKGDPFVSPHVIYFLRDWLVKHIKENDKRLGEFLSSRRTTEPRTAES